MITAEQQQLIQGVFDLYINIYGGIPTTAGSEPEKNPYVFTYYLYNQSVKKDPVTYQAIDHEEFESYIDVVINEFFAQQDHEFEEQAQKRLAISHGCSAFDKEGNVIRPAEYDARRVNGDIALNPLLRNALAQQKAREVIDTQHAHEYEENRVIGDIAQNPALAKASAQQSALEAGDSKQMALLVRYIKSDNETQVQKLQRKMEISDHDLAELRRTALSTRKPNAPVRELF